MSRRALLIAGVLLGLGLSVAPAEAAEPVRGNPLVEGPVISKEHRTHRITPQGWVADECWKLEIAGPEVHWFYGATEICVEKRVWDRTEKGDYFSGPYVRLAEVGPLAKPVG